MACCEILCVNLVIIEGKLMIEDIQVESHLKTGVVSRMINVTLSRVKVDVSFVRLRDCVYLNLFTNYIILAKI